VCGLSFLGSITFGASYEFPWLRFTNFFIGVLGCLRDGRQDMVVGRAAPPVEENWDSDEEDEERAVAAAGVMGEEEEEPGG